MPDLFLLFAREHFGAGYSPLYEQLARVVAANPALCDIAAEATPGQLPPNLLFASVRRLLMDRRDEPLAAFFEDLATGTVNADLEGAGTAFTHFCTTHREALTALMHTRRVQTNEAGRCAFLVPALLHAQDVAGTPLALIDAGCSAGFTLCYDRFAYDYGDGEIRGDASSPLTLRCEIRGAARPPLPPPLPDVARRTGVDINPLRAGDPETAHWLRALVWPGRPERLHRIDAAIAVAAHVNPPMVRGDIIEAVPEVIAATPPGITPVVLTTFVLVHLTEAHREAFATALRAAAETRRIIWLSTDRGASAGALQLHMTVLDRDGTREGVVVRHHPHGAWLEWVAGI